MDTTLNRRNFLKGALASGAVLMAGGALAGCASEGGNSGDTVVGFAPVEFAEETDVLIVGTGIAAFPLRWIQSRRATRSCLPTSAIPMAAKASWRAAL